MIISYLISYLYHLRHPSHSAANRNLRSHNSTPKQTDINAYIKYVLIASYKKYFALEI